MACRGVRSSQPCTCGKDRNTANGVRNFRHRPPKFRAAARPRQGGPRKTQASLPPRLFQTGAALPLEVTSINVFRAALVSVVLTLAIGQNAACCASSGVTTSRRRSARIRTQRPRACAPTATAPRVQSAPPRFVREDGQRTAPAPDAQTAGGVLRFRFLAPPPDPLRGDESGRRLLLEERPLVIALRIESARRRRSM